MTQEQEDEYRVAIAKYFGWKNDEEGYWISPEGVEYQVMFGWQTYKDGTDILPDYFGDLNEMYRVEASLSDFEYSSMWGTAAFEDTSYCGWLFRIVCRQAPIDAPRARIYSAMAAQRAEAFLRMVGLWEENS